MGKGDSVGSYEESTGFWAMTVERMVMALTGASPPEAIEKVPGTVI